jgi:hypothetical protein
MQLPLNVAQTPLYMSATTPSSQQPEPLSSPPQNFDRGLPPPLIVPSKQPLYRLNPVEFESALYFDCSGEGRLDGPNQGYGILYLGEDVKASFIECYGRANGEPTGKNFRGVSEQDLRARNLFTITCLRPLRIVDVTGKYLTIMGLDARISSGDYEVSRAWARAIHRDPQQVDGIRYRSRHDDDRFCYGLFDRVDSLVEQNLGNLVDDQPILLAEILDYYKYGLM